MAGAVCSEGSLAAKLAAVLPHLDERQRRLVMGAEARALGHGGIKVVARAAGVSAVTVSKGVAELEAGEEPLGRTRRKGGGRESVTETDPAVRTHAVVTGRPHLAGRSGIAAAVDDEVGAPPRRGDVGCRTCGFAAHGGETAQGGGVQPAGQREDDRGRPAPATATPSSAISTTGCASTRTAVTR